MNIKFKNYQFKLFILTLAIPISFGAQAGNVGSTFTDGNTLNAAEMTEIKDAVNDNDTRAIANEGDIFSNTAAISSLFGGDGSAGDLTVTVPLDWNATPPSNPNFANITINAGQTLTVPAGTTIRCSGSFNNLGTIEVLSGAGNAESGSISSGVAATQCLAGVAHPGDSFGPASAGQCNSDMTAFARNLNGANGGDAIPQSVAITSFNSFRIGGGAGAGWGQGGQGGGLLKVYCNGDITSNGVINAQGQNGSTQTGGGGGGIVILASTTSVSNTGDINVNGGDGSSSSPYGGAPGGGGGGILLFVAPSITVTGTIDLSPGASVTPLVAPLTGSARGGGGGGASGGSGGSGGRVSTTGVRFIGNSGTNGYSIQIPANAAVMMN